MSRASGLGFGNNEVRFRSLTSLHFLRSTCFYLCFQVESGASEQNLKLCKALLSIRTSSSSSEDSRSVQLEDSRVGISGNPMTRTNSFESPAHTIQDVKWVCPLFKGPVPRTPTISDSNASNRSSLGGSDAGLCSTSISSKVPNHQAKQPSGACRPVHHEQG